MTLDNGTKIRVIGGKHKGKWGHIIREMNEFSIVRLKEYVKSISLGDKSVLKICMWKLSLKLSLKCQMSPT